MAQPSPPFLWKSEPDCSESSLDALAAEFASVLRPGDVVQLEGPMGAGKSTFARCLIRALGGPQTSEGSPTFAILHEYVGSSSVKLRHADLYRLSSEEEVEAAGLSASVWEEGREAIHLIEWVSLFPGFEHELTRLPRLRRGLWRVELEFASSTESDGSTRSVKVYQFQSGR